MYRTLAWTVGVIAVVALLMYAYGWYVINFYLPKELTEFGKEHDGFDIENYKPFQNLLSHLKEGNDHVLGNDVIKDVVDSFNKVNKSLIFSANTYKFTVSAFKHYARKCINSDNLFDKYTIMIKFMIKDRDALAEVIDLQTKHVEWLKAQPDDTNIYKLNY